MNVFANRRELLTFSIIAALLVVGTLVGNLFQAIAVAWFGTDYPVWVWAIALFFLLILFFWIYYFASRRLGNVFGSDVEMTPAGEEPERLYIITGYSTVFPEADKLKLAEKFIKEVPLDKAVNNTPDFEYYVKDKLEMEPRQMTLNWQQNLRAAYHHRTKLKEILVLLPNEDLKLFGAFKAFMEGMFKKGGYEITVSIIKDRDGRPFVMRGRSFEFDPPNYEDYDYVYEGLRRGLDMVRESHDITIDMMSENTIVDTTPGIKIFSIAAAILTLNMDLKFSYVTNSGDLRFYDASLRFRYN